MKKFLKLISLLLLVLIVCVGFYFFMTNQKLPKGKKGKEAEALATKMFNAINHKAFEKTEILEWSFRNKNHYKWFKQQGKVEVTLGDDKIILNLNDTSKSKGTSPELIDKAIKNFNNDSFWLLAPYKIFDQGTERSIVKHEGKEALLITYTSGGSTPGDSYLWILDKNYIPTSYKMWTSIIPIGGVAATWSDWKKSEAGVLLPTKHKLSLFGLEINMGGVKAYNKKANNLADKILKALNHEAYKKTRYIEWSFAGRRSFKWDKQKHLVDVSWGDFRVNLYPEKTENSEVFFKGDKQEIADEKIVKQAWDIFNNDSFWLVGPHKLYDDGVIRNLETKDGKEALRVTYTTGGTTPGDSYVWLLDENYVPKSFKMYLKNGRMNGTPATWQEWITTESGTLLPTNHIFPNQTQLSMGIVKGYN